MSFADQKPRGFPAPVPDNSRLISARIEAGISQSTASGSFVDIIGPVSTTTNNGCSLDLTNCMIKVPTKGTYMVQGFVQYNTNSTGIRQVFICVNRTRTRQGATFQAGASLPTNASEMDIVPLNANDIVSIQGFQNSGGALTATFVSIELVLIR